MYTNAYPNKTLISFNVIAQTPWSRRPSAWFTTKGNGIRVFHCTRWETIHLCRSGDFAVSNCIRSLSRTYRTTVVGDQTLFTTANTKFIVTCIGSTCLINLVLDSSVTDRIKTKNTFLNMVNCEKTNVRLDGLDGCEYLMGYRVQQQPATIPRLPYLQGREKMQ